MAHELELRNGVYSYIEYSADNVVTAWHREGSAIDHDIGYDEAIVRARLDYPVAKLPTYLALTDENGKRVVRQSEMCFAVVRTDTGKELGRVGSEYEPVQNVEHFRAIESLMERGYLTIETAGVLRDGADAWILGKFDPDKMGENFQEVCGGEIMAYVLFRANHSGTSKNIIAETPIRVVCANTMAMAEHDYETRASTQQIRHTKGAVARTLEAAETLMHDVVTRYEKLAVNFKMLKATKLTDSDVQRLIVDVVAVDPRKRPEWNPEGRNANALIERYEQKATELRRAARDPIGASHDDSAWDAYNGAVQVIDHNTELFPTKGGALRSGALMTGVLRKTKDNVLESVLSFAEKRESSILDEIIESSSSNN